MVKTISGEEHKTLINQTRPPKTPLPLPVILVVAGLLIAGIGFAMGMQYQKSQTTKIANTTNQNTNTSGLPGSGTQNGFGRRRFGGQRPILGQVTTVDSSGITIKDQNAVTTTFSVTSNTTVTDNGQSASISTIKVGDTVSIIVSATDSKQAARILLNPNFNGNQPNGSTNISNPRSIN